MKKILSILAAGLIIASCNEVPIPGHPYDGPDYVYVTEDNVNLATNWVRAGLVRIETVGALISTAGGVYPVDRTFSVEVVPVSNRYKNVEGIYEDINVGNPQLPPASFYEIHNLIIPAGETSGRLGLAFLEDFEQMLGLKGYLWVFDIVLTPNENFEVWQNADIYGRGKTTITVTLEVTREYNS